MKKRVNIKRIMSTPALRREIIARVVKASQNREGIDTTYEQAEAAYDRVLERLFKEKKKNAYISTVS